MCACMCVACFVSMYLCKSQNASASFSVTHAVWASLYPTTLPPSQGQFSCSPFPPCSSLSRFCLGFPQEKALQWSWCKKYSLPDAQPGKAHHKVSPSLYVGLFLNCTSPGLTLCVFHIASLHYTENINLTCLIIFLNIISQLHCLYFSLFFQALHFSLIP